MRTRPWFKSRWPWVTVTLGITISLLVLATRSSPRKTTVRIAAPGPEHDRPRDGSEAHEGLRYLDAMSEPSLKAIATADRSLTVYRVVWLPTFHRPISVRVVKSETGATLHATQLDGAGGYQPGKVSVRKTVELSRGQWDDLSRLVSEARLWSLPSAGVPRLITDGDWLIFEGVRGGEHQLVERHCPEAGSYVSLCRFMLDLSGIEVGGDWEQYRL